MLFLTLELNVFHKVWRQVFIGRFVFWIMSRKLNSQRIFIMYWMSSLVVWCLSCQTITLESFFMQKWQKIMFFQPLKY